MHVAVVIERFAPQAGGNEKSTAQIVDELTARGCRVTVITGAMIDQDAPSHAAVIAMGERRLKSALQLRRFARWAQDRLNELEPDVSLSVTMAVPADVIQPRGGTVRETLERNIALRGAAAARAAKRVSLKLSPKQQLLLALERRCLADPRVKRIVAVSDYVVRQLDRHYGIRDDRVVVIPNASTMPDADDAQRAAWRDSVRTAFSVPDEAVVYLFAAVNPRLKGVRTLIDATRLLIDRGSAPIVLLAGSTSYALQRRAAARGVRDAVRFVGPTQQMPALYAAADVTVLPTFYDPSSKVVLESLMAGVPAISTAFNGASDFIAPPAGPRRGRVIDDPADAEALAQAMAELADPQARQACARATAGLSSRLSMRCHVDALERVLREAQRETS